MISGASPETSRSHRLVAGFLWATLAVTIFAGWFVVTRFSVTRELNIWDTTALRFAIGAVILLPVLVRRGSKLPRRAWWDGLLFATLWGAPFVILVSLGLSLTSAGNAASVAPTLMPVFAGLFTWLLLRERPGLMRLAGYCAIACGLAGLVWSGAAAYGASSLAGFVALALAAAMWAAYTLLFRRSLLTPLQAAALICFWSALGFIPAYLMLGLSQMARAPAIEIAVQAFYQGVLMSSVALVSFNRAVGLLGSAAATAMIALVPVVASLLAIPVLGEIPSLAEALSTAVIVAGVLLVARPARASAP